MKLSVIGLKTRLNLALLICIGLWTAQFIFIIKYAVNIPYWDEWEMITQNGFLYNPTLSQLFAQHNEHRIVTTKILTLILYYFDGWNLVTHQIINFIIYGILIGVLSYIVKKSVPKLPSWILLCFVVFLLTDVSHENHFWGFQTQFHLSLLFLFLSIWFLFNEKQEWKKILYGIIFSVLSVYSLSGGLIESLVVLVGYSLFKLIKIFRNNEDRLELLQLLTAWLVIGGAIGLYFISFTKNPEHPEFIFPYQKSFWIYFLNLISGGFGFHSANLLPGILFLLFLLIPVIGEIWKCRLNLTTNSWVILVGICSVLAALGVITVGRGGFDIAQSKSSRYSEIVVMLIPLSIALWVIFLKEYKTLCNYLLIVFWFFCVVSFYRYWNFPKTYSELAQPRLIGVQCLKDYYQNGGEAKCPTIYPLPLADHLDFDRNLPLSFIKEAQK